MTKPCASPTLTLIVRRRYLLVLVVVLILLPLIGFHLALLPRPEREPHVALVFGAGILNNQTPTAVLKNRLDQAVRLYEEERVDFIIVSGDNRDEYHDEPKVMRNYLASQGVPRQIIVPDFAGRRTIDSCWRAKHVFGAEGVYVVTQNFHLPRAAYLCRQMGLEVTPQEAKNASYIGGLYGYVREIGATWVAFAESFRYHPETRGDGSEYQIPKTPTRAE